MMKKEIFEVDGDTTWKNILALHFSFMSNA